MKSRLLYAVGPSGAGKDSLLAWLMERLPPSARVRLARRTITREAQAGGEPHEAVDAPTFRQLLGAGIFGFDWAANGLHYGVRHTELAPLRSGGWVIVNGSRAHLPTALESHPELTVLHVTASAQKLRQRLTARGREAVDAVHLRLQRRVDLRLRPQTRLIEIRNDATLEAAGERLFEALRRLEGFGLD